MDLWASRDSGGSWLSAEGCWRRQQIPSQSLCLQSRQCCLSCLQVSLRLPLLRTLLMISITDFLGEVSIVVSLTLV